MFITILEKINNFNESVFAPVDKLISTLPFEDWAIDAITDSFHLLPFLFFIFLIIEVLEFYFSDKIDESIKGAKKSGVVVGAIASIFPQCGFSVIASSLYSRKMITRGCLLAVYLGTSDESIPILLAYPTKAYLIIPIVGIKLFIAIFMGYLVDLIFTSKQDSESIEEKAEKDVVVSEEGCCSHNPETCNKRELILHPVFHTANIFAFILVITLVLNYAISNVSLINFLEHSSSGYIQALVAAFVGLIPNCAVSIAITMMLIKGTITFGAAMSGLLSSAGLGLLVLLKNNDFKDTVKIILILLVISIFSGFSIEFLS